MKIGAQLYTVRESCKTLEDFAQTLDRVADIGYTTFQASGVCAYEPEWLAEQLKRTGMTCPLTHFNYDRICDDTDKVVAEHNVYGCKHIGIGSMPGDFRNSAEGLEKFVEQIRPAAKRIKELGSTLMYHNHAFEYERAEDGRTYMQMLSDLLAPGELGFTLDTYWVKYGGSDPVEEIRRLSGRLPCVHFKDLEVLEDGTRRYTWVGGGTLDFEAITEALVASGTEYAFVEQDKCFDEDPFVCLKKCYDYLKSIGLN